MADMAARQGALSIALTNHTDSDLAGVSTHALDLHAGAELSVAATKTFVTSAVSAVWLLAKWQEDHELLSAINALPEVLEEAAHKDWSALAAEVSSEQSLFCLGRGPALAISNEAALKFKETCQLHAESYSSAEVLHGPVSIVDRGFPVLALTGRCCRSDRRQGRIRLRDVRQGRKGFCFALRANGAPLARSDFADRFLLRHGRAGRSGTRYQSR